MLRSFVFAATLFALGPLAGATPGRDTLTVPHGRHVLLDGRAEAAEWEDALAIDVAPDLRLLMKRDAAFLYVAVLRSEPRVFGVNLYLAPGDTTLPYLNLHASAKLGERAGKRAAWPEWRWWNNDGWSASVVRFNAFEGQRFLPDAAKEFQIALGRLPGPDFRLSLDLESAGGTEHPIAAGPLVDGLRWYAVRLSP